MAASSAALLAHATVARLAVTAGASSARTHGGAPATTAKATLIRLPVCRAQLRLPAIRQVAPCKRAQLLKACPRSAGSTRASAAAGDSAGLAVEISKTAGDTQMAEGEAEAEAEAEVKAEAKEEEKADGEDSEISNEYSSTMQKAMGDNALVYRHEDGINWAQVLPDIYVGSCPQKPADVDCIRSEANIGTIMCLQQDSDMQYFNLDLRPIIERVEERGDMKHLRCEIRDFDPFSLRQQLPQAVAMLQVALRQNADPAYIHCTAGLGRAPAVALAYMFWLRGFQLNDANAVLQKVRRCSPKLQAIRAATCDLLTGGSKETVVLTWRQRGTASRVEVAGLDIGWHNKLELQKNASGGWSLERELPVGTYYYKFIVDGANWSYSPDAQLTPPDSSGAVNNFIEVVGDSMNTPARALRKRLMEDDAELTDEDRRMVVERITAIADTLA